MSKQIKISKINNCFWFLCSNYPKSWRKIGYRSTTPNFMSTILSVYVPFSKRKYYHLKLVTLFSHRLLTSCDMCLCRLVQCFQRWMTGIWYCIDSLFMWGENWKISSHSKIWVILHIRKINSRFDFAELWFIKIYVVYERSNWGNMIILGDMDTGFMLYYSLQQTIWADPNNQNW